MKPFKVLTSAALATTIFSVGTLSAFAEEGENGGKYETKGSVTFEASTGTTDPVDPENPGETIDPENPGEPGGGTAGPLSIDFASSLDFGTNVISNQTEVYYAAAQKVKVVNDNDETVTEYRPNYVQISDNRGTNEGWTLTVKQNGQFTNEDTLNSELTGAEITLSDPHAVSASADLNSKVTPTTYDIILDSEGKESNVMTAQKGQGAMTWVDYFGSVEEVDGEMKDKEIQLEVPGSTPKDAVEYSTTLTWILSDTVTNDGEEA